jgi:D-inositol-3-phosphate glycosyltransferase
VLLVGRYHRSERYVQKMRRLQAAAGLHRKMRWLGRRSNVHEYMAAMDQVLVTSTEEPFGLVALEAQACGTPVIATRVGGLTTTVANGLSGLLVDGHNPKDWAQAINQILTDAMLATRLQQGAMAHAANFGWDRTTDELLDVYQHAVSGN